MKKAIAEINVMTMIAIALGVIALIVIVTKIISRS